MTEPLRIFVYGTLKSDQSCHALIRKHVVRFERANVRGRLFHMPAGYPMLVIPQESVLATGTSNAQADLHAQEAHQPAGIHGQTRTETESSDWHIVYGELLWLDATADLLARLDRYEGFAPGGESLFLRVLTTVSAPEPLLAWTYVSPDGTAPLHARLMGASWPA